MRYFVPNALLAATLAAFTRLVPSAVCLENTSVSSVWARGYVAPTVNAAMAQKVVFHAILKDAMRLLHSGKERLQDNYLENYLGTCVVS